MFDELLLDADWSLNSANWMWLSASAFFHQYFRVYSPIAFGKKTDPEGLYIKKYLPVLRKVTRPCVTLICMPVRLAHSFVAFQRVTSKYHVTQISVRVCVRTALLEPNAWLFYVLPA